MPKDHLLMLRPDWPGTFRRAIRDSAGRIQKNADGVEEALVFTPGEPKVVTDTELAAVIHDVGNNLFLAVEVSEGLYKMDPDGTAKFLAKPKRKKSEPAVVDREPPTVEE